MSDQKKKDNNKTEKVSEACIQVERLVSNPEVFGEHGLKGNSGIMPPGSGLFHVSANYDCNGMVFVEVEDDEWGSVWERRSMEDALKDDCQIISCHHCPKPAVSLDHLWPYHDEMNYCEDHKPSRKGD